MAENAAGSVDFFADTAPKRQGGLSSSERFLVQNLYDKQPKRREAFMKQIGFELDPENDNKFRPVGSSGSYDGEIDPGIHGYFKKGGLMQSLANALSFSSFKTQENQAVGAPETPFNLKENIGKIAKDEITKDITDQAFNIPAGLIQGVAATVGGALGAPGGLLGMAVGAAAGAGIANATLESIKNTIGDAVLNEHVPIELKPMVANALFTAAIAGGVQGIKSGVRGAALRGLEKQKEAVVNAIEKAGGASTPELIQKAIDNPEMFASKEAVQGGSQKLLDTYKQTFGLSPDDFAAKVKTFDQIPKDSVFGQMIAPVSTAAKQEVANLSTNPAASIKAGDILIPIDSMIEDLTSRGGFKADEKSALASLRDFRGEVTDYVKSNLAPGVSKDVADDKIKNASLNFGQAKRFLEVVQDKAFEQGKFGTTSQNPIVSQVAGEFRRGLDSVASNAGSAIPDLNAQQHEILSSFREASQQLTPENLYNAYIGGNKSKVLQIKKFVNGLDTKFGTDLSKNFEGAAAQQYFETVYNSGIPKGSSRVNAYMVEQAAKGALKGAAVGATIGTMTGAGPIKGAITGATLGGLNAAKEASALANPATAINALSTNASQTAQLEASSPIANPLVQAAASEIPNFKKPEADNQVDFFGD